MPLILLFLLFSAVACTGLEKPTYKVLHVIDGDSLFVKDQYGQKLELRLLGLDAPEYSQEPWGLRAREFLCQRIHRDAELEDACDFENFPAQIRLEQDLIPKDKYGRSLVYAYNQDGEFLNAALLDQGYAVIFILGENKSQARKLKAAEAKAREAGLNIWQNPGGLKLSPYEFRKQINKKKYKAST